MKRFLAAIFIPILTAAMLYTGVWTCFDAAAASPDVLCENPSSPDSHTLTASQLPVIIFQSSVRNEHQAEIASAAEKKAPRNRFRSCLKRFLAGSGSSIKRTASSHREKPFAVSTTAFQRIIISYIYHQNCHR